MVRDMTTGNPTKQILHFSTPLLLGMLFQQLYNIVDTVIIGQYLGTNALAAVGSTGSLTFFVLGLVMGACSGFAIPVAQEFGAGDEDGVRRCTGNIIYVSIGLAVVVTLLATVFTRQILQLMDTQEVLMEYAYNYLFWIFAGVGAQLMYNMLAGIIRSLGDSRSPVYFLIISSLLNVVLDILFVWKLNWGVTGAALATDFAQLISALLCLGYIVKKFPILHLSRRDLRPDGKTIRRLLNIGIPMGLQQSITGIGMIILQRSVNGLDVDAVASVSAATKIYNFLDVPMGAFGITAATFAGQNFGAGRIDRVRAGVRRIFTILVGYSVFAFIFSNLASNALVHLFLSDPSEAILSNVHQFMFWTTLFFPALACVNSLRNALQGVGYSKASMLSGLCELAARTLFGLVIVPAFGFTAVCFSNAGAWLAADAILIPMYIIVFRRLDRQVAERQAD